MICLPFLNEQQTKLAFPISVCYLQLKSVDMLAAVSCLPHVT